MKDWIKNALLLFGALAISAAGVEVALRLYGDQILAMGNQFVFFRFDDKLGWANTPNSEGWFARSEFRNFIKINSAGMRDREPIQENKDIRRIAVLGDSFTWGVGAEYGERFTELLEKQDPSLDVLNYGVSGFGPTQELVQLDEILAKKPDFVVLVLCLSNDVMDAISAFAAKYNRPFARRGADGSVEIAGYPLVNARAMGAQLIGGETEIRLLRLFNVVRVWAAPLPPTLADPRFRTGFTIDESDIYTADAKLPPDRLRQKREALDIVADVISLMKARVDASLGPNRFLVAFVPTKADVIPSAYKADEMGNQLLSRLRARGVDVFDPRADYVAADFWKRDGHWNQQGHAKFAALLAPKLRGVTPVGRDAAP